MFTVSLGSLLLKSSRPSAAVYFCSFTSKVSQSILSYGLLTQRFTLLM